MRLGTARPTARLLGLAALISLAALVPALITPATAYGQATSAASGAPPLSRFDIFVGYSYVRPYRSDIDGKTYPPINFGADGNVSGYFTRHLGLQVEGNYSPNGKADNNCAYTAQAGPIFRYQKSRFVPFAHALGGGAIFGGPAAQKCNVWGVGATGGLGLDIILPFAHDRIAVRPIQADLLYAQINNGPVMGGGFSGGNAQILAMRGSAGIVFRLGNMDPTVKAAPAFNCSADPGNPFPGDPVTISSSSSMNVNPKRKPSYLWSTSGGKIAGSGANAAVDTADMQPGTYSVTGKLVEGDKQRLVASCMTSFTVRNYEPPTVSCAVNKAAINSGDTVLVTSTARSPQSRPLTYTYATTGGNIANNGPTAALATAGVSPGNITVTCNVADDKGHAATSSASIVVATPAPPPVATLPTMQSLCTITFDRDIKRPARVDNEAKGCLDDVALNLNRASEDKLLIIGTHGPGENNRAAAERAMNAADYLTHEKGIDPSRLDLRVGPDSAKSAAMMLVPPGAVVDAGTATSFDTSSVKRSGQPYGTAHAAPAHTVKHRTVRKKTVAAPVVHHTRKRRKAVAPPQ